MSRTPFRRADYVGRHRTPPTARPASRRAAPRFVATGILATGMLLGGLPVADAALASPRTPHVGSVGGARPLLHYGSRNGYVLWVQRKLGVRPTSGWFGPITRAAVMRYQASRGIRTTGMVGPLTWAALLRNRPAIVRPRPVRAMPTSIQSLNWTALARCESSNNPRAVNPSGRYFGLYQFDLSTWRSVGGSGYPHHASSSEQTYRAQLLYRSRGAQPWPVCGRYLFT